MPPLPPVPSVLEALGLVGRTRAFALRRSCTLAVLAKVSAGLASDASLADVVRSAHDHGALLELLEASDLDDDARFLWDCDEAEDPEARIDLEFLEKAREAAADAADAPPPPPERWHAPCFGPALADALEGDDLARLESVALDLLEDQDELALRAVAARVVEVAPSAAALHAVRARVRAAWQAIADEAMPDAPGEACWSDQLFDAAGAAAVAA